MASSSASRSFENLAKSRSSSLRCLSCSASGSPSASSIMTRKSSNCFSAARSGSIFLRREPASSISFCAWSRLFQKVSLAISASSWPRRFRNLATSKKPPQVGQFLAGCRQLCSDGIKHIPHPILLNRGEGKGNLQGAKGGGAWQFRWDFSLGGVTYLSSWGNIWFQRPLRWRVASARKASSPHRLQNWPVSLKRRWYWEQVDSIAPEPTGWPRALPLL